VEEINHVVVMGGSGNDVGVMSNSHFVSVLKLCLEVFCLLAVHLQP
jgi:hypothetical protein